MTFIPTQTVQNAFEVCGGHLSSSPAPRYSVLALNPIGGR